MSCYSRLQTPFDGTFGRCQRVTCLNDPANLNKLYSERPDTIRSIVANLVGDDESGDSLVDESEPNQPLQHPEVEDYTDPSWEPEPIDAGPGNCFQVSLYH